MKRPRELITGSQVYAVWAGLMLELGAGCSNPNAVDCQRVDYRTIAIPSCVAVDYDASTANFSACIIDASDADAALRLDAPAGDADDAAANDAAANDAATDDAADAGRSMDAAVGDADIMSSLRDWPWHRCQQFCPPPESVGVQRVVGNCGIGVPAGTPDPVSCQYLVACIGGGRRPASVQSTPRPRASDAVGDFFARAAQLESASIDAFEILRAELRAHGAPERFLRAASRCARDEVRHAAVTARLARRYGASVSRPRVDRGPVRSLEQIAVENAREGCVMETWGVLLALHQARTASDPSVRRALTAIARDEARHAALAWRVAAWADPRLSVAARKRVRAAREEAVGALREAARVEEPARVRRVAGLPSRDVAMTLIERATQSVWG